MTPPSISNSQTLSYAAAPRRRGRRRLLAGVFVVVVAVGVGWLWRTPLTKRLMAQWHERRLVARCENYCLSPDVVCFEADPARAAGLLKDPAYRSFSIGASDVYRIVDPWRELQSACKLKLPSSGEAEFCHLRRSPSGNARLVVVADWTDDVAGWFVLDPGAWGTPPKVIASTWYDSPLFVSCYGIFARGTCQQGLRLYAGQADPADASHFTIRYECPQGAGTIDGWLLNSDRLRFRVLDGPGRMPLSEFEERERRAAQSEAIGPGD